MQVGVWISSSPPPLTLHLPSRDEPQTIPQTRARSSPLIPHAVSRPPLHSSAAASPLHLIQTKKITLPPFWSYSHHSIIPCSSLPLAPHPNEEDNSPSLLVIFTSLNHTLQQPH